MRKIYILLSKSSTIVSMLINLATKEKYTHSSISFSSTKQPLYSMGRKYTPFIIPARLKQEPFDSGFYKWHNHAKLGIYYIEVSDEAYEKSKTFVESLYQVKDQIKFSGLGLLLCKRGINKTFKNKYFCSQFVSEALLAGGEVVLPKPPALMRPMDFLSLQGIKEEYQGNFKAYLKLNG